MRYQEEREGGSVWAIRDRWTGYLVEHAVLRVPERFRSVQRVRRRVAELEAAGGEPSASRIRALLGRDVGSGGDMADDRETLILACAGARRAGLETAVRDGLREAGLSRVVLPVDRARRVTRNSRGEPQLGRRFMARTIGHAARVVVVPNPDRSIGAGTVRDLAAALEGGKEILVLFPDGVLVDFADAHLVAEAEPSNPRAASFTGAAHGPRRLPAFRLDLGDLLGVVFGFDLRQPV